MISKKILAYKTRSNARKNLVIRSSMAYKSAQQIGILFSIDDKRKHDVIKRFVKQLEADGKKIDVLAYLPKKKENHEFLFNFFTTKDVTFWGNFTSEQVIRFVNKPFDYLFYIDIDSNPFIRNILAMCKAKCRVGKFDTQNEQFCELMIQTKPADSIQHLVDEMYKYTKILS